MRVSAAALVAAVLVLVPGACGDRDSATSTVRDRPSGTVEVGCDPAAPVPLSVEVLDVVPHRTDAFTQGLVFLDGRLFESTGRRGESSLRELDARTGDVLRLVELDPELFGEGLAPDDRGRLVQLTWTDGVALVWDPDRFEELERYRYEGEGWGLAALDDGTLAMSDGTDTLTLRRSSDFSVLERRQVTRVGGPVDRLNELGWDGESLWANRYLTDELVRIEPGCWRVTGVADLAPLRSDAARTAADAGVELDVSNGVAHVPGTVDEFLLTGKYWPTMYRVRIGEAGDVGEAGDASPGAPSPASNLPGKG